MSNRDDVITRQDVDAGPVVLASDHPAAASDGTRTVHCAGTGVLGAPAGAEGTPLGRRFDVFRRTDTTLQCPVGGQRTPRHRAGGKIMTTGDDAGFSMVSSRFALGRPNTSGTGETAGDPPHVRGRRPYGMRFFEAVDDSGTVLPRYRYCPDQQVAVSDDGADEPLVTRIVGWDRTTSGQHDGNKGPQEEWHLDHRIES